MNPKPLFILFGAQRRVGKDTAAKLTVNILSQPGRNLFARPMAFASGLRFELQTALAASGFHEAAEIVATEDPTLKERVMRPLLIAYGQARRYFNPTYWVDHLHASATSGSDSLPNHVRAVWVISDWRFPNEYRRLVELAGAENVKAFTIVRPGAEFAGPEEAENAPKCAAISELIYNSATISHLKANLEQLFEGLKHPTS